ncbi:leucyl aminopeptidase [Arcobacter roscoffensis]|uniref:Leucyl aminopeptidase n=1 Tax=Arcobacter roscoffensis TaxID=2961520 RepID=A0ABY5E8B6_9BACT|nr:leucyl aminopeptidase [Arcobacter roscoffensis]UTJ06980.1 leucyl aminopeptidase [Arcobacter roscoffensis]
MNIVLKTREKKDDEIEIILLKNTEKLPTKTKTILRNINFKSSNFNTYFETSSKKLFVYIKEKDSESIKIAISKAVNTLKKYTSFYIDINFLKKELKIEDLVQGFILGSYEFLKYKKKEKSLKTLCINIKNSQENKTNLENRLKDSLKLCQSVNFVRDIVNTPAQDFYPKSMAKEALELAKKANMSCKVYGEDYMQENSLNAMYAVGKASIHESQLIHLSYKPCNPASTRTKKAKAKIVLVGKGVTYDTGGLSLKRGDGMVSMKIDKAGAISILGVMKYLSQSNLDIEVHAILGAVENMIDSNAYKPDDVIKIGNKTVEITNTDAEGRLVLADCLVYAQKNINDIDYIFDLATLTGSSIGAFGGYTSAVLGHSQKLKKQISKASSKSGELVGFMPYNIYMQDILKSGVADILNSSANKNGAAIIGSMFLDNFIDKKYKKKWLHFDIAGPSYRKTTWGYNPYGATGAGVRLVVEFLKQLSVKNQ